MEAETQTILIVVVGFVLIIILVLLIAVITSKSRRKILEEENKRRVIEKEQQLALFKATADAEENQKRKIASNLHDQIIPVVAFSTRNMYQQISELEAQGVNMDKLKKEVDSFRTLSDNIREISHDLIPQFFVTAGLIRSLGFFIDKMNKLDDSAVEFHNETIYSDGLPLSDNDQLTLYRICLEILNNLFKHAKYDYLTVTLEEMDKAFTLQFVHDGKGITNQEMEAIQASSTSGIGLKSMQSRLLMLNATLDYTIDSNVAYIKLIVPKNNESDN